MISLFDVMWELDPSIPLVKTTPLFLIGAMIKNMADLACINQEWDPVRSFGTNTMSSLML